MLVSYYALILYVEYLPPEWLHGLNYNAILLFYLWLQNVYFGCTVWLINKTNVRYISQCDVVLPNPKSNRNEFLKEL